mmetsp:Transcript_6262/g.10928  ORF Transcript_6262/g.10928 Transcript_6262/m.10928 type:complete len:192 (+) Transcript_6262:3-578(+)
MLGFGLNYTNPQAITNSGDRLECELHLSVANAAFRADGTCMDFVKELMKELEFHPKEDVVLKFSREAQKITLPRFCVPNDHEGLKMLNWLERPANKEECDLIFHMPGTMLIKGVAKDRSDFDVADLAEVAKKLDTMLAIVLLKRLPAFDEGTFERHFEGVDVQLVLVKKSGVVREVRGGRNRTLLVLQQTD